MPISLNHSAKNDLFTYYKDQQAYDFGDMKSLKVSSTSFPHLALFISCYKRISFNSTKTYLVV